MTSETRQPDPSGAGGTAAPGSVPGHGSMPEPPISVLSCPSCAKKNRIRPSDRGAPHCGSCDATLPWVVSASDGTFDLEARSSVTVLVDLWAPWCGPCRVVSPMLEELAAEFAGRLKIVKVNVDENPLIAQRFQAMSIPTLVVIRDGRVVDRLVGAVPKTQLKVQLTSHLLRR